MGQGPGRDSRTRSRLVVHAIFVRAHFSPCRFADSEQKAAAANLGRVRADGRRMVLPAGGGGLVGRMEILSLDVSGACVSGLEHAELAQIHRARRTHRFHGEQLYPEHCVRGACSADSSLSLCSMSHIMACIIGTPACRTRNCPNSLRNSSRRIPAKYPLFRATGMR